MASRHAFGTRLRAAVGHHWRRASGLLAIGLGVTLLLSVDVLFAGMQDLLSAAGPLIRSHPVAGGLVFVVLSALAAMLAFFSSALLVPVAVYSWGRPWTALLLWIGWLLGGVCAYAAGRFLGRPLVRSVASARLRALYRERYLERLPSKVDVPVALLIQLALPSEIPGYLFGTLRVPLRTYLPALALVEAPYAAGTVLLGECVLRRDGGWLLVLAAVGLGASLVAAHVLHRRLGSDMRDNAGNGS